MVTGRCRGLSWLLWGHSGVEGMCRQAWLWDIHLFTHSLTRLLVSPSSSLTPWSLDNMGLFPALMFLSSREKEGVQ